MSTIQRYKLEQEENWNEIIPRIPSIHFDPRMEVKLIPPFAGAIARFYIEYKQQHICSVYLDWYGTLGLSNEPYYELYPDLENDTSRYLLQDIEKLEQDLLYIFEAKIAENTQKDK